MKASQPKLKEETPMPIQCFILYALLLGGQHPKVAKEAPPAWKQDVALQVAVFQRLYKNYCGGKYKHKMVFLAIDTSPQQDPVSSVVAKVSKILPAPVKKISECGTSAPDNEQNLKTAKLKGTILSIGDVELKSGQTCEVEAGYRIQKYLYGSVVYRLKRTRGAWEVMGSHTRFPPDRSVIRGKGLGHTCNITLAKNPFRPLAHHIRYATSKSAKENNPVYYVDGQRPLGVGEGVPSDEMSRFEVEVDGVKWKIPASLWKDCHFLHLPKSTSHYKIEPMGKRPHTDNDMYTTQGRIWMSGDGKHLWLILNGADGDSSYTILWSLQAGGHCSRKLVGEP